MQFYIKKSETAPTWSLFTIRGMTLCKTLYLHIIEILSERGLESEWGATHSQEGL